GPRAPALVIERDPRATVHARVDARERPARRRDVRLDPPLVAAHVAERRAEAAVRRGRRRRAVAGRWRARGPEIASRLGGGAARARRTELDEAARRRVIARG